MSKKKGIVYQVKCVIDSMLCFGESKHEAKQSDDGIRGKIFSYDTRATYIKQTNHFVRWCNSQGYKHDTLMGYKPHVPEYLRMLVLRHDVDGLSASTIKTRASALGKVYQQSINSWGVDLPLRKRDEIKRSRLHTVRDTHFSEAKHADFVTFCKCTGLRRCELERLKGDQFQMINGKAYITNVVGKGGKIRDVEVIGNVDVVRRLCERAKDGRVFPNVYKNADVHGYRGEYASALYKQRARPYQVCRTKAFYNKEHYNGKGHNKGGYENSVYYYRDGSGRWLDKSAMLYVSQQLGHDRISVVASNYLYNVNDLTPNAIRRAS